MKNILMLVYFLFVCFSSFSQYEETININIVQKDSIRFSASVEVEDFENYIEERRKLGFRLDIDRGKDFTIEGIFEIIKKKSSYGIGFWNANGGNTAGFLINEKGEYLLHLLFDGSSCLLDGERSHESWKGSQYIHKRKGNINKISIEKRGNIFSVYINGNKVESYELHERFEDYYFTHYGIQTQGKNIISKVHSFTIEASLNGKEN